MRSKRVLGDLKWFENSQIIFTFSKNNFTFFKITYVLFVVFVATKDTVAATVVREFQGLYRTTIQP